MTARLTFENSKFHFTYTLHITCYKYILGSISLVFLAWEILLLTLRLVRVQSASKGMCVCVCVCARARAISHTVLCYD